MKLLLSVNKKFYEVNMKGIFDLIDKKDLDHAIGGIELYIDTLKEYEVEMAVLIAKKLKERKMKLQIHATKLEKDVLKQYEYLKLYHKLSQIMEEKILVVYHPFEEKDKETEIYLTSIAMKRLNMHIEDRKYNLKLTLENLDDMGEMKRLKLEDVYNIAKKIPNVGLTYDIGHEVVEGRCKYELDKKYIGRIKNIHLHDISLTGVPHYPFYAKKTQIKKVIKLLKEIDYKGNIVLEIALDYLRGNTYEEKLEEYLNEFIYVKKAM